MVKKIMPISRIKKADNNYKEPVNMAVFWDVFITDEHGEIYNKKILATSKAWARVTAEATLAPDHNILKIIERRI